MLYVRFIWSRLHGYTSAMPQSALVIIAKHGFQDHEFTGTRTGLEAAGFAIVLASTEAGPCVGKFGGAEEAELSLSEVRVEDYDRVAFIGGPGAHQLRDDPEAHRIARETVELGKILGAICIAPTILAAAGILQNKRATVWNGDGQQAPYLAAQGAEYVPEPVVVDGRIVTGDGPEAAAEFGKRFAGLAAA